MKPRKEQVSPDGARMTPLRIQQGLKINILAGALGTAWWVMSQGMPLTMLFEALGSSGTVMGLVSALIQMAFLMQIPAALLAERIGERKLYWARVMLVGRFVWFLPAAFLLMFPERAHLVAVATLCVAAVSAFLQQSVSAFWFSWMADLVPERVRGRFWGMRQSWTMLAYLLAMIVAGYVLDLYPPPGPAGGSWRGFELVFILSAFLGCADIIIHLWVPEPRAERNPEKTPWLRRILEPLRQRDFRLLTFSMGLYLFSLSLASLGIVYLKKDFHVTYLQLAALTISASLGTMLLSFIWGYVMDRIGGRALGAIMLALLPLVALPWFFVKGYPTSLVGLFAGIRGVGPAVQWGVGLLPAPLESWLSRVELPQAVWLLSFSSFLAGAICGGIGLCQINLSSALTPERSRTMAMAVHWSIFGLLGAAGALLAGRALDFFAEHPVAWSFPAGTHFSFQHAMVLLHMLIIWGFVLPVFLGIRRRKEDPSLRSAFNQLLVLNPFRAVANIYAMGDSSTPERRAQAALSLGEERTSIAVQDLIEKLSDPSLEVREAAVSALGSIGSEPAVRALVQRLEDPNSDLNPQIARALRGARSAGAVNALLRKLSDPDRETRVEVIRALGDIGDQRCVPALMAQLGEAQDDKVVAAVGESVAQLGELSAVYELLPRLRRSSNPLLRSSLAVAVGDLLGEPDEFYRVLSREQRTKGAEIDRMMRDLRRDIRGLGAEGGAAGRSLIEKTQLFQILYEEERYPECAAILYEMAGELARLRPGGDNAPSPDPAEDPVFRAGLWLLDTLRKAGSDAGQPAPMEILLGAYFLHKRGAGGEKDVAWHR